MGCGMSVVQGCGMRAGALVRGERDIWGSRELSDISLDCWTVVGVSETKGRRRCKPLPLLEIFSQI